MLLLRRPGITIFSTTNQLLGGPVESTAYSCNTSFHQIVTANKIDSSIPTKPEALSGMFKNAVLLIKSLDCLASMLCSCLRSLDKTVLAIQLPGLVAGGQGHVTNGSSSVASRSILLGKICNTKAQDCSKYRSSNDTMK